MTEYAAKVRLHISRETRALYLDHIQDILDNGTPAEKAIYASLFGDSLLSEDDKLQRLIYRLTTKRPYTFNSIGITNRSYDAAFLETIEPAENKHHERSPLWAKVEDNVKLMERYLTESERMLANHLGISCTGILQTDGTRDKPESLKVAQALRKKKKNVTVLNLTGPRFETAKEKPENHTDELLYLAVYEDCPFNDRESQLFESEKIQRRYKYAQKQLSHLLSTHEVTLKNKFGDKAFDFTLSKEPIEARQHLLPTFQEIHDHYEKSPLLKTRYIKVVSKPTNEKPSQTYYYDKMGMYAKYLDLAAIHVEETLRQWEKGDDDNEANAEGVGMGKFMGPLGDNKEQSSALRVLYMQAYNEVYQTLNPADQQKVSVGFYGLFTKDELREARLNASKFRVYGYETPQNKWDFGFRSRMDANRVNKKRKVVMSYSGDDFSAGGNEQYAQIGLATNGEPKFIEDDDICIVGAMTSDDGALRMVQGGFKATHLGELSRKCEALELEIFVDGKPLKQSPILVSEKKHAASNKTEGFLVGWVIALALASLLKTAVRLVRAPFALAFSITALVLLPVVYVVGRGINFVDSLVNPNPFKDKKRIDVERQPGTRLINWVSNFILGWNDAGFYAPWYKRLASSSFWSKHAVELGLTLVDAGLVLSGGILATAVFPAAAGFLSSLPVIGTLFSMVSATGASTAFLAAMSGVFGLTWLAATIREGAYRAESIKAYSIDNPVEPRQGTASNYLAEETCRTLLEAEHYSIGAVKALFSTKRSNFTMEAKDGVGADRLQAHGWKPSLKKTL